MSFHILCVYTYPCRPDSVPFTSFSQNRHRSLLKISIPHIRDRLSSSARSCLTFSHMTASSAQTYTVHDQYLEDIRVCKELLTRCENTELINPSEHTRIHQAVRLLEENDVRPFHRNQNTISYNGIPDSRSLLHYPTTWELSSFPFVQSILKAWPPSRPCLTLLFGTSTSRSNALAIPLFTTYVWRSFQLPISSDNILPLLAY